MGKFLFINACVRPESRTLRLARQLLDALGGTYDEVDVTDGSVRPLDRAALEKRVECIRRGDYADPSFDLARQLAAAQTVVIAAPFWDLSFPSFLKLYFENVLVAGLTFTYQGGRPEGLCKADKLYYVTTAGGAATPDFGYSYVQALAESFLGIPQVRCFRAEGLDVLGSDVERILAEASEEIRRAVQ